MNLVIHGPNPQTARKRLELALAGSLQIKRLEGHDLLVLGGDDELKHDPVTGATNPVFADELFEVKVTASEQNVSFVENECNGCGYVTIASEAVPHCMICGGTYEPAKSRELELSEQAGDNMKVEVISGDRKTVASNQPENGQPTGNGSGGEAAPATEAKTAVKAEDGPGKTADEQIEENTPVAEASKEAKAEDNGPGKTADEQVEENTPVAEASKGKTKAEDGPGKTADEQIEENTPVAEAGEDDLEELDDEEDVAPENLTDDDDSFEDDDGENFDLSSDNLVVCSRDLNGALLRFGRNVERRLLANKATAKVIQKALATDQPAPKYNISGALVGQCEACDTHIVASNEAKTITCANCSKVLSKDSMVVAAMEIDPEAEDEIELVGDPDGAGESEDGMGDDADLNLDEDLDMNEEMPEEEDAGMMGEKCTDDVEDSLEIDNEEDPAAETPVDEPVEGEPTTLGPVDEIAEDEEMLDDPVMEDDGDHDNSISELDLSELSEVNASDKVDLAWIAVGGDSAWQLRINSIPVSELRAGNIRTDLKSLANDKLNSEKFAKALHATVLSDPTKAIATAREIGFTGIKIPMLIDKVIRAKAEARVIEAKNESTKFAKNYEKRLLHAMSVVAQALNKGFYAGHRHPVKEALVTALQKAGVPAAQKLVHAAFAEHSDALDKTTLQLASEFIKRTPAARNEIAAAVGAMAYQEDAPADGDEGDGDAGQDFSDMLSSGATTASAAVTPAVTTAKATDSKTRVASYRRLFRTR